MSMYGANPDQLAALGRSMKLQMQAIDGVVRAVGGALAGTAWVGPARQRFEDQWNTTFKQALARLQSAFDAAGTDCVNRSTELVRVMGAR